MDPASCLRRVRRSSSKLYRISPVVASAAHREVSWVYLFNPISRGRREEGSDEEEEEEDFREVLEERNGAAVVVVVVSAAVRR